MATPDDDNDSSLEDPTLELALSGTPTRVLDAVLPDAALHRALDATREAMGLYGLVTAGTVAPDAALRSRVLDAIDARAGSHRRALVVVDMIEDYLTPGHPLFVPRAREIVSALAARIAQARRDGEPVVFVHDFHERGDTDLEHWPAHAEEGSTGWQVIAELAPREGDVMVPHRTYSGFFETALDEELRRRAVDTLVLTGCATELQLFTTAADALMRGYQVEVPPDCHAGTSEAAEQAALRTLSVMRPTPPRLSAR